MSSIVAMAEELFRRSCHESLEVWLIELVARPVNIQPVEVIFERSVILVPHVHPLFLSEFPFSVLRERRLAVLAHLRGVVPRPRDLLLDLVLEVREIVGGVLRLNFKMLHVLADVVHLRSLPRLVGGLLST